MCRYCERCHGADPYVVRLYGEHGFEQRLRPGEPQPEPAFKKRQWDAVQQLQAQTLHLQRRFWAIELELAKVRRNTNVVF